MSYDIYSRSYKRTLGETNKSTAKKVVSNVNMKAPLQSHKTLNNIKLTKSFVMNKES